MMISLASGGGGGKKDANGFDPVMAVLTNV